MSVSSSSREIASGVDAEPGDADGRILQFDDVTLLPELLQWRRIGKEKRNLSNPITNFFFIFLSVRWQQVSIPGAVSTVTRQVQTNFEPRSAAAKRLTRSSSAVNQEAEQSSQETGEEFFQPLGRRADELSQSQPEEIGGEYDKGQKKSPPDGGRTHPRAPNTGSRRRQLLKALSEGTILLDRKRARRFASGYVEVNVNDDERSPPQEETVAGRILVHDPTARGSSYSSDSSNENLFAIPAAPSNLISDEDPVGGCWSDASEPHPPPPLAEEETMAAVKQLQTQKSFDSNASLPDTAGNYSDEFGSTSQVTVLQPHSAAAAVESAYVIACDSDDVDQHPPTPPPRRPIPAAATSESATELSETEKEIMVQFPPWPGAQELIPAPPSFASSNASLPQEEEEDLLPPPPLDVVVASPNKQMTDRVLLRHLKHGSKSMSETITSVDSDSSGRRVTEHETSASSEPLSPPASELNSPLQQADVLASKAKTDDSADNSDAFLTALSDHLTTAGLTEVFNTAMERSERSFRESDTSHNSTLRMDQSGVQDLPYEEPPPPQLDVDDESGGPSSLPQPLTSPDSNNEGPEFCRESSTSGSYSLEATPCASLSPPPVEAIDSKSSASQHPAAADRKTLKEGMKLQFPPGSSMFSPSSLPSPSTTPSSRVGGGRRKHFTQQQSISNQLSSTDSEDNEENTDRSSRKRRSNKSNSASAATEQQSHGTDSVKRPSAKHKKSRSRDPTTPAGSADGVRKRDSQIVEATTPGMVRSPAMHEGFRMADWVSVQQQPLPHASDDPNFFTLQHPSESGSSYQEASAPEVVGMSWKNLMPAPSPSNQQNCESIRSVSPGSDNVFVSETVDLPGGNGVVVKPPEGFADSPATLVPDWNLPSPGGVKVKPATDSTNHHHHETKRKRDSGRGKRTKSCTLPAGSNLSSSGLSLEGSPGSPELGHHQGPMRAVSTIDMWYPETQLPPKRQLTVRAKSEERERWSSRPGRR